MSAFDKLAMDLFEIASENLNKTAREEGKGYRIDPLPTPKMGPYASIPSPSRHMFDRPMSAPGVSSGPADPTDDQASRLKTKGYDRRLSDARAALKKKQNEEWRSYANAQYRRRRETLDFRNKVKARAERDKKRPPKPGKPVMDRSLVGTLKETARDNFVRPFERFGSGIKERDARASKSILQAGRYIASVPSRLSKQVSNARAQYNLKPAPKVPTPSGEKRVDRMSKNNLLAYRKGSKPPTSGKGGGQTPRSFASMTEGRHGPMARLVAREKYFASKKK